MKHIHRNNKVAVVLGGIKGIGMNIALNMLNSGIRVATAYFDWEDNFKTTEKKFTKTGTDYIIEKFNLLDTKNIIRFVENVIKKFGKINILINNIERGGWPIIHKNYTKNQWYMEIATILQIKQWVFKHTIPYLKASGDGSVINISSIAGIIGRSGPSNLLFNESYSAANRGISLLTKTWAHIGAPEVKVNEIMLGIFETRHGPQTKGWKLLNKNQRKIILDQILTNRIGKIKDIVKTIKYLLKDAPFLTGSIIKLDGGYNLKK